MSKMKTRLVPAILAAMALTMLAGCGGKDKAADATEATTAAVTEAETKETETEAKADDAETKEAENADGKTADDAVAQYLDEVDTMNKAAEEFIKVSMDFMQLAQEEEPDLDAMTETIEKTRATKQAFVDFSALDNPPEGLEEAHERLAKAAREYADTLEVYCDVLLASINGEEHEAMATIQDDWTKVGTELGDAMGAVQEAADALE